MKDKSYVQAISIVATFSLIFLIAFTFNLTKAPLFLMLAGLASMGYMFFLLGSGVQKKTLRAYIYITIGLFLMILCVISCIYLPKSSSLFF